MVGTEVILRGKCAGERAEGGAAVEWFLGVVVIPMVGVGVRKNGVGVD